MTTKLTPLFLLSSLLLSSFIRADHHPSSPPSSSSTSPSILLFNSSSSETEGSHESNKLCESLNCAFKCKASLEGGVCYCDTGMTINPSDKRTCIDLDECKEWGYCDQLCANTEGSFKCSCSPGYTLIPPRHCKANNSEYLVYFSLFIQHMTKKLFL